MKMERRARKKTAYSGKEKRQSTNGRIKFQELQKRFPLDYINKSTYHMEFILLPENRFRKVLMDLQKKNHISEELARQVYYAIKKFRFKQGRTITKKEFSKMPIVKENPILAEKIKLIKDPKTFLEILDFMNDEYERRKGFPTSRQIQKKFPRV